MKGESQFFTLIELLIVVGIIMVLLAMLLPVLGLARERGRRSACVSHLKTIGVGLALYADEYDDYIPPESAAGFSVTPTASNSLRRGGEVVHLGILVEQNLTGAAFFGCPSSNPGDGTIYADALDSPYLQQRWNRGEDVDAAYLYRANIADSDPRLSALQVQGLDRAAIVMDRCIAGDGEYLTHGYRWTNVGFRDGHAAGGKNSPMPGEHHTDDGDLTSLVTIAAWYNADQIP